MISAIAVLGAFYLLLRAAGVTLRSNKKTRIKTRMPGQGLTPRKLRFLLMLGLVALIAYACGGLW